MSLKQYRLTRGVRSYAIEDDAEGKRSRSPAKPPADIAIHALESKVSAEDPARFANSIEGELDKSFETSVQFRTVTDCRSPSGKPLRGSLEVGKITLNPGLVADSTGRALRSSLEQRDYLQNLLHKGASQGGPDSSLDLSRNRNTRVLDSSKQGVLRSVDPRAHGYAREVDFIRPPRAAKMRLQQSFDYDSARHSSVDHSSYAQYMNARLGATDSKRGQSSAGRGSAGKQWARATTRAQTSTGQSYYSRGQKPGKSGLTHRSIGSAMAMRASARVPFGTSLESVPSQLETQQASKAFARAPARARV